MHSRKHQYRFGKILPPKRFVDFDFLDRSSAFGVADKALIVRSASPFRHREPGLAVAGFPSTAGSHSEGTTIVVTGRLSSN